MHIHDICLLQAIRRAATLSGKHHRDPGCPEDARLEWRVLPIPQEPEIHWIREWDQDRYPMPRAYVQLPLFIPILPMKFRELIFSFTELLVVLIIDNTNLKDIDLSSLEEIRGPIGFSSNPQLCFTGNLTIYVQDPYPSCVSPSGSHRRDHEECGTTVLPISHCSSSLCGVVSPLSSYGWLCLP